MEYTPQIFLDICSITHPVKRALCIAPWIADTLLKTRQGLFNRARVSLCEGIRVEDTNNSRLSLSRLITLLNSPILLR